MPDTVIGLLLLLAAASPGFVYAAQVERRVPRRSKSDFRELSETVLIGSFTTVVALSIVLSIIGLVLSSERFDGRLWQNLVASPRSLIAQRPLHLVALLVIALLSLALSAGLAALLARVRYRAVSPDIHPDGFALFEALGQSRKTFDVFCTVELDDGRRLHGYVKTHSLHTENPENQEIVLTGRNQLGEASRGLYHQAKLEAERTPINADYILLRGGNWRILYSKYVPRKGRA